MDPWSKTKRQTQFAPGNIFHVNTKQNKARDMTVTGKGVINCLEILTENFGTLCYDLLYIFDPNV